MKVLLFLTAVLITSSCQSHHRQHKVVLVDNQHKHHRNYAIVNYKPKKHRVCKKHKKHWHCVKV